MADAPLPAAGWYADGSTAGVRRWFDGTAWTEHTMPEPSPQAALAFAGQSGDGRFATTTAPATEPGFATTRTPVTETADRRFATTAVGLEPGNTTMLTRIGMSMSPEDYAAREAKFEAHRIGEARRIRRGAVGAFCSALALLAVTAGISLALHSPDELWGAGGIGAAYLVWRAMRDYGRAVFKGAPRLPVVGIALATVGLVAAVGLFVAVPVTAAHQVSHALTGLDGLSGLSGLPGAPAVPTVPDPTG